MRAPTLLPFVVLVAAAAPVSGQQSETSKQIDRNIAAIEAAIAKDSTAGPAAGTTVTGPPSVAVGIGETVSFRLTTKSLLLRARRIGGDLFTGTTATDSKGIDVTVTGAQDGTGHVVFTFADRDVDVEILVGSVGAGGKPKPIPAISKPTPPGPTPPDPPKPPPPDPPIPPPPPPPEPPLPPVPVTPQKLVVVIVEETADAVATRGAFLADKSLSEFMTAHGHRWRVVDKDVTGTDGRPPADVARFLDKAKSAKLPTLFLVDPKGRTVHEGPVPAKAADLTDLLRKWGGQ